MKEAKKAQVTEQICEQIRLMRKGGANQTEIGKLLGLSAPTISRIESAGYDLEKYLENKRTAREKEAQRKQEPEAAEEQVPGQIRMEIPEKPQGVIINAKYMDEVAEEYSSQVKLMRFLAGQVDKLYMKLDTINNTVSQILRATRGE